MTDEFEERVFEVEKRGGSVDGAYSQDNLNEQEDGPGWFESRSGRALTFGLEEIPLPMGWKWSSNWKISIISPNADAEGWVYENLLRRRRWIRRRERIGTSSTAVTASSSRKPPVPTEQSSVDETNTNLRICTEALQRLDECILRLGAASGRKTIETIMREGKEAIADCQRGVNAVDINPVRGAAKIKICNDLTRDQKRFELALQYAFAGNAGGGGAKKNEKLLTASPFAQDNQEEEEYQLQQLQQQQLQLQKSKIISYEIDANSTRIEERHKEIVKVHQMTHQVNGMMKDLAGMVAQQGDDIRTIKASTAQTKDNMQKGLVQVEKAEQYQKDGTCALM